ncbi:hypothetical protein [Kingella oralis]|uniref:hypothetical protein n=1 Tax=Kingella oralis TaxID=505 RepID=UPI0034E4584B
MTFPPTLFPYLAQTGAQSIASLTALTISPDERAEHAAALRQILTEQNGYLSREQSSAYYPAELLEYALYHPEHAQAYTMSVLILLQTAVWHRQLPPDLEMAAQRYQQEVREILSASMRQALDEAFRYVADMFRWIE